jgi:hypothetical protein
MDLLLSDHRPRSRESATPVIAGQHSSTDQPHRYRRIGRLPSRCPPKSASDCQKNLSGTSARSPAAATHHLKSLARRRSSHRLTGNTPAAARQASLQRPEFSDSFESVQTALFRAAKSQLCG